LHGRGCHQDTELAFQWISLAADSGHPAVISSLERAGLDISKLSDGYKQYRQAKKTMTGDSFGEIFDHIFGETKMSIRPVPPGE